MPDFTPEQQAFISKCLATHLHLCDRANDARKLGLVILAHELDGLARSLQDAIANQERAFRDQTLAQQLDFNHRQEGE